MWVLMALAVGVLLFGLLLLFGRDRSEEAVATARATTVTGAAVGERVRIEGVLSTPKPLKGPASGRELAFLSGTSETVQVQTDYRGRRYEVIATSVHRDWGDELALSDQTGAIAVDPMECEVVLPTCYRGRRWQMENFDTVAGPDARAYEERGIPNFGEVLLVGVVESRDGKRVLTGGSGLLLSALTTKKLRRRELGPRIIGGVLTTGAVVGLVALGVKAFFGTGS